MGADGWRPHYAQHFTDLDVVLLPDNDEKGQAYMETVAAGLRGVAGSVRVLELPGLPPKGDVTDWLDAGHTIAELIALADIALPRRDLALADVVTVFQKWLHLSDLAGLYAVLGTIVGNLMPGTALWLMLVGGTGRGKTELLHPLSRVPKVRFISNLTGEAAFLSATPKRDKSATSKGGLLAELGAFGILVLKDFTSVLQLHRDARAAVLSALREIHDGKWSRTVGSDGGYSLEWVGKVGLLAGCTGTIDNHHGVISAMGERFIFCRLPAAGDAEMVDRALAHAGEEDQMRRELGEIVAAFVAGLTIPDRMPRLSPADSTRLRNLTMLAAKCRSAVERDNYRREIELVPDSEGPARFALALARLLAGMQIIGVNHTEAWRVVTKCALDSMPAIRRKVFDLLRGNQGPTDTASIAQSIEYPTVTARRACEDLTAHGVVVRQTGGKADKWVLSDWARRLYDSAVSETSGPTDGEPEESVSETSDATHSFSGYSSLKNRDTIDDDFSETVGVAEQVEYPDAADDDAERWDA